MNIEAEKLNLISWITLLNDPNILEQIENIKKAANPQNNFNRKFGCGKGLFTYISDDFTEPLEEFRVYTV
jgi:hypothetical protein